MSTKLELMLKESIKQTLLENPELLQEIGPMHKKLSAEAVETISRALGGRTPAAVVQESWRQMMGRHIKAGLTKWAWTAGEKGLNKFGRGILKTGTLIETSLGGIWRFLPFTKLSRPAKAAVRDAEGKVVSSELTAKAAGRRATLRKNMAWAVSIAAWQTYLAYMEFGMPWYDDKEKMASNEIYQYLLKSHDPIEWVKYWWLAGVRGEPETILAMHDFSVADQDHYYRRAQELADQLTNIQKCYSIDASRVEGQYYNPDKDPDDQAAARYNWEIACVKRVAERVKAGATKLGADMSAQVQTGVSPYALTSAVSPNPEKPQYNIMNTALNANDILFACLVEDATGARVPAKGEALQQCQNKLGQFRQEQDQLILKVCNTYDHNLRACNKNIDPETSRPYGYSSLSLKEKTAFDLYVYGILPQGSKTLAPTSPTAPPTELAVTKPEETEPSSEPV